MAREKVLVVEDDPSIGMLIKINLEFEDYVPILATDGEMGLIKAGSEKPDLILLDVMLPKMNGFDVLANLKKSNDTASIPVIMLTALGQEEDLKRGYDLGAVDYISKPFSINRLLSGVESHVRKSKEPIPQEKSKIEEKTKVAIVGAGETGTYLINVLQVDPHFEIVGISDLNNKAEGLSLAKKLNLPIYEDITFFAHHAHAECVLVTDALHYHTVHEKILNVNSQEIVGPVGINIFLYVIRNLENREKVTRAVLREYKQVVE